MNNTRSIANMVAAQRDIRIWEQAYESIVDCPTSYLRFEKKDGSHYILSPSVEFTLQMTEGEPESWPSHRFAIAGLLENRQAPITEGSALYLVIDDVVTRPAMHINKGGPSIPHFQATDDGAEVDFKQADLITDKIYNHVAELRKERQRQHAATAAGRRERWKQRFRRVGISFAAITVLGLGSGAGYWMYSHFQEQNRQEEAAAKEVLAAYDARGIELPGAIIRPGQMAYLNESLESFNEDAPDYTDTITKGPRELLVSADEQKKIGQIDPGAAVKAVVKNAPQQSVSIGVRSNGEVWIDAIPSDPSGAVYTVLIQLD